jgi:hypothetical protein
MLRAPVAVALAAVLVLPSLAVAHETFPSELEQFLEPLPGGTLPQPASHDHDVHSDNMFLVANNDDAGTYRQGSDLAFWGNLAVLGNYDNPGGFRLMDIGDPSSPTEVGQFVCRGPQSDVSIWRDLVFVSVDTPMAGPECGAPSAGTAQVTAGGGFEGIRGHGPTLTLDERKHLEHCTKPNNTPTNPHPIDSEPTKHQYLLAK